MVCPMCMKWVCWYIDACVYVCVCVLVVSIQVSLPVHVLYKRYATFIPAQRKSVNTEHCISSESDTDMLKVVPV